MNKAQEIHEAIDFLGEINLGTLLRNVRLAVSESAMATSEIGIKSTVDLKFTIKKAGTACNQVIVSADVKYCHPEIGPGAQVKRDCATQEQIMNVNHDGSVTVIAKRQDDMFANDQNITSIKETIKNG